MESKCYSINSIISILINSNVFNSGINFNVILLYHHTGEVPPNIPTSSPAGTSTSKLYIPSDHNLSLPIRRYISSTVINQLLVQPSHALACVLMVAVEALNVVVTKDIHITLEDACRMVSMMMD